MDGSRERVRRVMAGERPDRAPLFDLLPNDAVLAQFNEGVPVEIGDDRAGFARLRRRSMGRGRRSTRRRRRGWSGCPMGGSGGWFDDRLLLKMHECARCFDRPHVFE